MITIAWHDVAGMAGVAMILAAFFGLQAARLRGDGLAYQLLNLVGASLVLVSLVYDFNLSAFVIESAWVLISLYGIVRSRRARRTPAAPVA